MTLKHYIHLKKDFLIKNRKKYAQLYPSAKLFYEYINNFFRSFTNCSLKCTITLLLYTISQFYFTISFYGNLDNKQSAPYLLVAFLASRFSAIDL